MPNKNDVQTRAAPAVPPEQSERITDGLTTQLFGKQLEPDRPAPTLDYDSLRYGAIVVHKGIRVIEYRDRKDGRERKTKLHMFATRGGDGGWFSVFGSANLDSQLRKASVGAILLLRYAGKEKVDGTDQEQHMWEVRQTAATKAQIAELRARPEWRDRELALDGAIQQAALAETERRQARASGGQDDDAGPPPHDDADRPF